MASGVIEATIADGFVSVASGNLLKTLSNVLKNDNRAGVQAPRRCEFITGKMGSSKTTSVLEYAEHQLRTGKIKSVLYVCPRTVQCSQIANKFEGIHQKELSTVYGRNRAVSRIEVGRYYFNSKSDVGDDLTKHLVTSTQRKKFNTFPHSTFDCCVINSIWKLPLDRYDMVISDDPTIITNNLFMSQTLPKSSHGVDFIFIYECIIKRAHRVFFVDSAFTQNTQDLCEALYSGGTRRDRPGEVQTAADAGHIILPKNPRCLKEALNGYVVDHVVDEAAGPVKKMAPIQRYTVFDPTLERPIFENLVEYPDWYGLVDKLVRVSYSGHKSIVYCSLVSTAKRICAYIRANPPHGYTDVPLIALVTADTIKEDGRARTIDNMLDSQVAIVTGGLGIGTSFGVHEQFDSAFGCFELANFSPRLDDMIRFCGRVRATTERTLHYTVRTTSYKPTDAPWRSTFLLPQEDTEHNLGRMVSKSFHDRETSHEVLCGNRDTARETIRAELSKAFSHTSTKDLEYRRPLVRVNPSTISKQTERICLRRTRRLIREVDNTLQDGLTYVNNTGKFALARGNMKDTDYDGTQLPDCARLARVMYTSGGHVPVLMDMRLGGVKNIIRSRKRRLEITHEDNQQMKKKKRAL
jgi:hypothetical protein